MNVKYLLPLVAITLAAGCGKPEASPVSGSSIQTVETPDQKAQFKVALLTPGAVSDSGWNALAYKGLMNIQKEMGATVEQKVSAGGQIATDMRAYARQGYNLVFGHGFEYNDPAMRVAKEFPKTVFVTSSGGGTAHNVGAFRFDLEEGFYIAGYMAALMSKTGVIGSVSVANYPSIVSTLKAYEAGAKAAKPSIFVVPPVYFGVEGDVARAKSATDQVINQNADFIIHQANTAAQGVFDACKDKKVYCFGSNSDQNDNPAGDVIASAVIVTDTPFLELAQTVKRNAYVGAIGEYAMSNDAIDFVINPKLTDKIPVPVLQKVNDLKADIKAGRVDVPKDKF